MSKKKEAATDQDNRIVVFQEKSIRRTWHQNEWWFVVEDVVLVLVDSKDPKQYIQRMKQRDPELGKGWVQIVHILPIETSGGIQRMVCANTGTPVVSSENYLNPSHTRFTKRQPPSSLKPRLKR